MSWTLKIASENYMSWTLIILSNIFHLCIFKIPSDLKYLISSKSKNAYLVSTLPPCVQNTNEITIMFLYFYSCYLFFMY
jgi:hypothetical protein